MNQAFLATHTASSGRRLSRTRYEGEASEDAGRLVLKQSRANFICSPTRTHFGLSFSRVSWQGQGTVPQPAVGGRGHPASYLFSSSLAAVMHVKGKDAKTPLVSLPSLLMLFLSEHWAASLPFSFFVSSFDNRYCLSIYASE